jgi:predicted transcriptional regulator of viral defense system
MKMSELVSHISAVASSQHGLVRVSDVDDRSRRQLRHLAERHLLERVGREVYRISGSPVTWEQRLQAGVWSLGDTAVVSHAAAARLHGFEGFTDDTIEFTVERHRRGTGRSVDGTVHTTTDSTRHDSVRVRGLPVTSGARTVLDLARAGCALPRLEAAVDSAIRLRLTTLDRLIERARSTTGSGRWGYGALDSVLLTSGGHTFLERAFLKLVRRASIPMPTPQVVHRRDGRHVARVDFLFPEHGVVVEVSGGRGHSSAADRAKDARRRNELQQLGWLVLEFTYEDVMRRPSLVVATLERALAR